MSLLRQPILLLARSQGVKKLVSTMPVSSGIVTSYVPGEATADAVRATQGLVDDGLRVTLDHLGHRRRLARPRHRRGLRRRRPGPRRGDPAPAYSLTRATSYGPSLLWRCPYDVPVFPTK